MEASHRALTHRQLVYGIPAFGAEARGFVGIANAATPGTAVTPTATAWRSTIEIAGAENEGVPHVLDESPITLAAWSPPDCVTQQQFLQEVNQCEDKCMNDCTYLPIDRTAGHSEGHTSPSRKGSEAVSAEWGGQHVGGRITTLAVRNLPLQTTQQEFLNELNQSGFVGTYDFVYLPRHRETGLGGGHAFVNFKTVEMATAFAVAWFGTRRCGISPESPALTVVPSLVQGFHANAKKWRPRRLAKVKNQALIPFMLGEMPTEAGVKNSSFVSPALAPHVHSEALYGVGAQGCKKDVTTLVVRNVPPQISTQEFLDEINESGFGGMYDYAYVPLSHATSLGCGHAFVNFKTKEAAIYFAAAWDGSSRFRIHVRSCNKALSVVPSSLQGLHQHTAKWTSERLARVRNAKFSPFMILASFTV